MRADVSISRNWSGELDMNVLDFLETAVNRGSSGNRQGQSRNGEEIPTETSSRTTRRPIPETDEIVFPETRILTLLEEHGGRMWQQGVIAETGYSAAKVSGILTKMEDDGQITRYWKNGRKVVVDPDCLPAALSP